LHYPLIIGTTANFKDQLDLKTLQYTTLSEMFAQDASTPKGKQYVSTDGTVVIPAARAFQQGPADTIAGWRFSDNLDTYGFITAVPGRRIYVSSSSEDITYSAVVGTEGTLSQLQPFANRGGECVAVDRQGNVYVANGQIFVYAPTGRQIGQIDVPERPLDIVFGGSDDRTLFILSHHSLFAVKVRDSNDS